MKLSKLHYALLIALIYCSVILFGNDFLFSFIRNFYSIKSYLIIIAPMIFILYSTFIILKNKVYKNFKIKNYVILGISILLIVWCIISIFTGIKTSFINISGIINVFVLISLVNILSLCEFSDKQKEGITKNILIVFLIVCIYGIFQYIYGVGLSSNGAFKYGIVGRVASTFYISTLYDKYLLTMISFLFFLISKRIKVYYFVLLFLGVINLALTYSRTGFIIFGILVVYFILYAILKKKFMHIFIPISCVFFMFCVSGFPLVAQSATNYVFEKLNISENHRINFVEIVYAKDSFFERLYALENKLLMNDRTEEYEIINDNDFEYYDENEQSNPVYQIKNIGVDKSINSRDYYESVGIAVIKNYPITGIGIGNYYYIQSNQNVDDYLAGTNYFKDKYYMYPHNNYIHVAAEIGIIGLVLYLSLIIVALAVKKGNLNYHFLSATFITMFLLSGLSESIMHAKHFSYAFIILSILIIKISDIKEGNMKKTMAIFMPKLSIGGMEKALINFLNYSNFKNDYEITLYLGYVTERGLLNQIPNDIKVILFANKNWNFISKVLTFIKMNYLKLKFIMQTKPYDVSISYAYQHKILANLTRLASNKSIIFIHSDLRLSRNDFELKRLLRNLKYEKFNKIICVSEASKESLKKLINKDQIYTVNNYINGDYIIEQSKEKVKNNKSDFVVVARLEERAKKISRILESVKILKGEGYKFKICIVGGGKDLEDYKNYVNLNGLNNFVDFVGFKLNPYPYIKNSKVMLMSSDFEGNPVIFLEAKVLNVPIITTDVSDAKKDIDKKYGVVVKKDTKSICNAMKNFLDGKIQKIENFDYNEYNNNITKKYEEIINE